MTVNADVLKLHVNLDKPAQDALVISDVNNNPQVNTALVVNDIVLARVYFYYEDANATLFNTALPAGSVVSLGGGEVGSPATELLRADGLSVQTDGTLFWYEGLLSIAETAMVDAIGENPTLSIILNIQVQDTGAGIPTYRRTVAYEGATVYNDYLSDGALSPTTTFTPSRAVDWTQTGTIELLLPDPFWVFDILFYADDTVVGLSASVGVEGDLTSFIDSQGEFTSGLLSSFNRVLTGGKLILTIDTAGDVSTNGRIAVRGARID